MKLSQIPTEPGDQIILTSAAISKNFRELYGLMELMPSEKTLIIKEVRENDVLAVDDDKNEYSIKESEILVIIHNKYHG